MEIVIGCLQSLVMDKTRYLKKDQKRNIQYLLSALILHISGEKHKRL